MRKIAVFTSGGDAPGMNACIRAVVRAGIKKDLEVVGILRGYAGMIAGDFLEMKGHSVSNIIQLGGTILRSARSDEFRTVEGRQKAYDNLKAQGIEGVVAIGGDGTFTGANIFMQEHKDIAFIGVPGTIDNDLYGTDYTIGYDTAINTAMNAIDNIKDTANAHDRLFFIEVMGRDAGFIALRTGIATGAEAVLVPESHTDINRLIETLEANHKRKKNSSIVIVAEGDDAGGAFEISRKVKERFNEYDMRVTILGHIQRGGRPTCMERVLASRLGVAAVDALVSGRSGVMVGQINKDIVYTPFEKAIKHHQRMNPMLLDIIEILS
ncbi:MAG: 6-phosphofructokinase [Phaeodactylibacter sp.]|nr:6-phosphofructokinase [Phaeodactylibacter sp.]